MSKLQTIIKAAKCPSIKLNHTMLRIKDPKISIPFYEKHFGMSVVKSVKFPQWKFDLYYLAFQPIEGQHPFNRYGVLELTHNYGTESDPEYKLNNGNVEPHRGFGHICFSVDNIAAACEELEASGVKFQKKLSDGRMKTIAFVLDPNGYWIELIENGVNKKEGSTDRATYKFNHTMIRVKDAEKSLSFYQNVLGMKVLDKSVHEGGKFTNYFLSYQTPDESGRRSLEGLLELTHNWGTESDPEFKYHNGNDQPQGYGHICVSLDNAAGLCEEIEQTYGDEITWGLKFNKGNMKNIAFIRDPDNYSIEIMPNTLEL